MWKVELATTSMNRKLQLCCQLNYFSFIISSLVEKKFKRKDSVFLSNDFYIIYFLQ